MKVKFDPGQIVITPTAMNALAEAGHTPGEFLRRHVCGDWGQLDRSDVMANESALRPGSGCSRHTPSKAVKFFGSSPKPLTSSSAASRRIVS